MNAVVELPRQVRETLVEKFAGKYSIEPAKLLSILKATAFKQRDGEVSNEQMAALLVVADQYGLNPFTREIFAFPDKQNGIVPVVGVDGWSRIINNHPQSDGFEFRQSDEIVEMDKAKPCPAWIEVVIYRKDRAHPVIVREYIDEVYRAPFKRNDGSAVMGPWQTHTKRFLRHKTLIQGARIAYGFGGIYDEDEAERIIERDITPEAKQLLEDFPRPAPSGSATAVKQEAWSNTDADMKIWLTELAAEVKILFDRGDIEGAYDHLQEQNLDSDNLLAIDSQFDSKLRTAFRKIKDARATMEKFKNAHAEPNPATDPALGGAA